jgi:hypothetical protein
MRRFAELELHESDSTKPQQTPMLSNTLPCLLMILRSAATDPKPTTS